MPPLSLLIKPASSLCNLDCRYCFYHDVAENRATASHGILSDAVLETMIRKALEFADGDCTFAFQGGEPTVAGLPFFERVVALQQQYNTKKVRIHNAIQTNGIAIDAKWAQFLAKNRFLTGVSLDGPRDIHDANRVDARERGSFDRVMVAIEHLKKAGAEFNILSVVTGWSARHAAKIYRFFKQEGFAYLQFIPCLDPFGELPFSRTHSLTPERYASFLISLFDLWKEDALRKTPVSIRWFDNLAGMLLGAPPEACGMSGRCTCQFVVEADGGVYPCDFYVLDEWKIGSILTDGFVAMRESEPARRFIDMSLPEDPACSLCEWRNLCRGGCRRYREPFQKVSPCAPLGSHAGPDSVSPEQEAQPGLNLHCEAYRTFFTHALPGLRQVAALYGRRTPHEGQNL